MRLTMLPFAPLVVAAIGLTPTAALRANDTPARLQARSPAIAQQLRTRSVFADSALRVDTARLRRAAQSTRGSVLKFVALDTRCDSKALTLTADWIRVVLGNGSRLEFRRVPQLDDGTWRTRQQPRNGRPIAYEEIVDSSGRPVPFEALHGHLLRHPPMLTGADMMPNARAEQSRPGTQPLVFFEFNHRAKRVFEDATRSMIGKHLGIFLDRKLIAAPVVNDAIPGKGILEGNFSLEFAKSLANTINGDSRILVLVGGRSAVAASGASLSKDRVLQSQEQAARLVKAGDVTGGLEQLARDVVK